MASSADLARELVRSGGSGDAGDANLVAARIATFTMPILTRLLNDRTTIVACRGSITDYLTQLRGQQPRGWPPGSTWDTVPGIFFPQTNEVVIAILGHDTSQPHIPTTGEGQGSADVVLHESSHGVDMGGGQPFLSASQTFASARNPDLAQLSDYEKQVSPAGEEETFAESAARFFTGRDGNTPHLHAYWAAISQNLDAQAALMAKLPANASPSPDEAPVQTIGTASMSDDHTITLQLRATTGTGARGDALIVYQRGHPSYDYILQHLGGLEPNQTKHVPPFPGQP
jgi:hypothetical protein